ncbi:hypothetical protein [Herbaspirillum rhizosphaerae]|uniref:hypothetical protein n=1 Tax=Herbaspirillum rhizosphaerae TaxID=346179 RepID=UPI00067D7A3F|nr:hypothetical protein [Herbaspirillum rhizosphaerae]
MDTHPNETQAREHYAEEMVRRYRELRRWAVENWPNTKQPLVQSDFVASDRELLLLLGARLHAGEPQAGPANAQYEDVTPMPWP